jgi:Endodeoxyribonuclease RusA
MNRWFIPGNVPSSKNGRRWTGKYFIASKTVVNYRKTSKAYYEQYADEFKKAIANCTLPVRIGLTFIRNSRHKFDYINPAQTVQDDMVNYGWIDDDNADVIIPVFIEYVYDKKNPGVMIELLDCKNIQHMLVEDEQ